MNGRFYRIPIAAQAVYEQLRVWIDLELGLPGPRGETWFPPTADAPQDATHLYAHLLEEHYQLPEIKPWVDQTVATTWMEPITAEEYFAATAPVEEGPTEPETEPEVIAWAIGQTIAVGDLRTHGGQTWRALLAHTTHEGWAPSQFTPTIWQPQ